MKVECSVPNEHQGDIMADLNRRRGKIMNVQTGVAGTVIEAEVPLMEMFGYANCIRSLSKGRAAYSMQPSHFEPVPSAMTTSVLRG
jgi:elongation factor G